MLAAAGAFADASHPDDEFFALAFNERVRSALPAATPFTSDRVVLRQALDAVIRTRGRTALYDAIVAGLDYAERAVVLEGDDDAVLKRAVGHLPDTPLPWEAGNSALAGHRDTFFRGLRHIRTGDLVRLETPAGSFEYEVAETRVVEPDALEVLAPTPERVLTLITCYPFTFVGAAPQRFVVRAREKS